MHTMFDQLCKQFAVKMLKQSAFAIGANSATQIVFASISNMAAKTFCVCMQTQLAFAHI